MPSDFDEKFGQGGNLNSSSERTEILFPNDSMEETSVSRPSLQEMRRRAEEAKKAARATQSPTPTPQEPPEPARKPKQSVRPSLRDTDGIRATGVNNFAALIGKARKNLEGETSNNQSGGLHIDLKRARDEVKRTNQKIEENEGRTRHQLVDELTSTLPGTAPMDSPVRTSGIASGGTHRGSDSADPNEETEFIPSIAHGSTEALFGFRGAASDSPGFIPPVPIPGSMGMPAGHPPRTIPSGPPGAPPRRSPPPAGVSARTGRTEKSMIRRINELASSDLQEKKGRGGGRRGTSGVLRLPESEILEAIAQGPPGPYRIRVDDLEYGPTDASVILKLVEKGLVTGADEISKGATGGWQRLESHTLFINYLERPIDEFLEEDSKINTPALPDNQFGTPPNTQVEDDGFQFPDETRPANASYSLAKSLAAARRGEFNKVNTSVDVEPPKGVQETFASRDATMVQGPVLTSPMRPHPQHVAMQPPAPPAQEKKKSDFTEVSVSDIAFQISQFNEESEADKNSYTIPGVAPSKNFIDDTENTPSTPPPRAVLGRSEVEEGDPRNRTQLGHQAVVIDPSLVEPSAPSQADRSFESDEDNEPTLFIEQEGEEQDPEKAPSSQGVSADTLSKTDEVPTYATATNSNVPQGPPGNRPEVRADTLDDPITPATQPDSSAKPDPSSLAAAFADNAFGDSQFHESTTEQVEVVKEKRSSSAFMWVIGIAIALLAIGATIYAIFGEKPEDSQPVVASSNDPEQPSTNQADGGIANPELSKPEAQDSGGETAAAIAENAPSDNPSDIAENPADAEDNGDRADSANDADNTNDAANDDSADSAAPADEANEPAEDEPSADDSPAAQGESDLGEGLEAAALAVAGGDDARSKRMELMLQLQKDPKNQSLIDAFDQSIKEQATHPPAETAISASWEKFRQVGSNPTVYRTKSPDGTEWDFTPEHEKGPTWRGAYAFYQLCGIIDCAFAVPEARLAYVPEADLEGLVGSGKNLKISKGKAHGVLTKVLVESVPFQIEDTSIWRNWLSRRTPIQTLNHTLLPVDFNGGSDATRTALAKTGATVAQVAESVANILAVDYLTNNFGRFARHRSDYGQRVRFLPQKPFLLYAIDNDDAFQARESTRVRGRFNWSDRMGHNFVDSLRRLKPEYVSELLFPDITGAEKASMSVFWEQRSDLLNTVDRRVDSYGVETILF